MTLIISMCTKSGIYMISDTKITNRDLQETRKENKNCIFEKNKVGLSFWGVVKNDSFDLLTELNKLKGAIQDDDDIEIIANKIKEHFEKLNSFKCNNRLGFHLAGYIDNKPILRHIFHEFWLKDNQFLNENSNLEYHIPLFKDKNTFIVGFNRVEQVQEFPMLFNGDSSLPNLIINGITLYRDSIDYANLTEEEAKEFLIFLMKTAIKIQKFRKYFREKGRDIIGYPLNLTTIKRTEIKTEEIDETQNKK